MVLSRNMQKRRTFIISEKKDINNSSKSLRKLAVLVKCKIFVCCNADRTYLRTIFKLFHFIFQTVICYSVINNEKLVEDH